MRDFFLDELAVGNGGDVVGGRPVLGCVLLSEIELSGLERLQRDSRIAVVVDVDLVEVVATLVHRQILCPVVPGPLVGDGSPRIDLFDPVGPAAQRELQRGLVEFPLCPPGLGQDGQLTDDQRQLPVLSALEAEFDPVRPEDLDLADTAEIGAVERVALGLQRLHRERDIFGSQWTPVVESGLRAQVEDHPTAVLRNFHALGNQSVAGEGFVIAAVCQRVEDQPQAAGLATLEDIRIEAVKTAHARQAHIAAFGRVRFGVVEMREIRGIFQVAVHGQTVRGIHGNGVGSQRQA